VHFTLHFGLEGYLGLALYFSGIVAFLLSVFWRPQAGLYFLIPLIPLQTFRYTAHGLPWGEHLADIVMLGVMLGMLFNGRGEILPRTSMNWFLVVWILLSYFALWRGSFFLNKDFPLSISDPRFDNWKNYMLMPLLFFLVLSVVKNVKQMKILLLLMCVSIFIVNKGFYNTVSVRDLSHFDYNLRYAGQMGYAGENGLGAFAASMALFLLGLYPFERKKYRKLLLLGLIASSVYVLLFVFSRGAYVAFLIGLLFIGIFKERKLLVFAAVLLFAWQVLLPKSVQERITMTYQAGELDPSAQTRLDLWQEALDMTSHNPIMGSGYDTYEYLRGASKYTDTHNYYLKVLVETGFVGLLFFLWLLWKMLYQGQTLFFRAEDPFLKALGLAFAALIVGTIVLNLFGDRWTYFQVNGYMGFVGTRYARAHPSPAGRDGS
jgi:O-antigen ligase